MSTSELRASFFRQSSWMMVSTFISGVFMFAVHFFGPLMGEREYGLFTTLLGVLNLMMIPALGLQTVFAQQAAACIEPAQARALSATVRGVLRGAFVLWLSMAAVAFLVRRDLMVALKIENPAALWMTVALGLPQLWTPVMMGVLQGTQRFLWLGWAAIVNGVGRFAAVAIIVSLLGGQAAGAVTGAWIGLMAGLLIAGWHSRSAWAVPGEGFKPSEWMRQIVPLTLGLGASQFMVAADMIMVRMVFDSQTGYYGAAGMIGRGLVIFTAPVAVVVFPKIVSSVARSSRSNVLGMAVIATAAFGAAAALAASFAAWATPWVLETVTASTASTPALWATFRAKLIAHREPLLLVTRLIPGFVWSMLPFAVANVLIYNLLARRATRAIPWLVLVAVAYATALSHFVFMGSFAVVQTVIAVFALLLLGTALFFTRSMPEAPADSPAPAP
jgi:O-antigen/teichoic acid export membrane protein